MKHIYLIALLSFTFYSFAFGQSLSPNHGNNHISTEFQVSGDFWQDINMKIAMTYVGEEPTRLVWQREVMSIVDGWESAICDPVLCYGPNVNTESFPVEPGEEFDMSVHLYPRGFEGDSALVVIAMYDESDPNEIYRFSYLFKNSRISSTDNINGGQKNPVLYPNPAGNYFYVHNDFNVTQIEVFNVVGQRSLSVPYYSGNSVDVNQLRPGLYFVKLMNDQGVTIRTLRLNKK